MSGLERHLPHRGLSDGRAAEGWAARPIFVSGRTHAWGPLRTLVVVLAAVAALAQAPPAAPAPTPALSARLSQSLSVPHVSSARSAALALDLDSGAVVFSHRAAAPLSPASTEKLPLTYALLVNLGPAHRIPTRVFGEGDLDGETWRGDLVLKGYGDPTLTVADLRRLAAEVRSLGIRRVTGSVAGDESYFDERRTGPGWKPSYLRYSAPLSALVVDRARAGRSVTHRPALAAATTFRAALVAAGVQVAGGAKLGRTTESWELAHIESTSLVRLIGLVNRDSDNFVAEQLLKHLGAVEAGRGTTAAGAAVVTRTLRESGVPLTGVRIADGSGLSLDNRLTARALVGILHAAWTDAELRPVLVGSLAVAARDGTLRRRLRGTAAAGRVVAKTGTTLQASALAGYVDGRYAFAVLQNGSPVSHAWARTAQDRFVTVLVRSQQR